MNQQRIAVSAPSIGPLEQRYVADAVASTWVGPVGPYVERFRHDFAQATGVRHAIPVSNGTVALHLALLALGVGPGDEVVVPSLTYVATVNAVIYCGATPVFADVEPDSWGLAADSVRAAVSERTKAIVVVHLYGMPASMRPVLDVAADHQLPVVEDAAEAPFASYEGRPTGSLGRIATFSFYGNKIVTCGEGGAVATDDDELAQRVELLRGQGMDPDRRYWFPVVGYNYRLTNVAAAMLCAQLERRAELLQQRWQCYHAYDAGVSRRSGLTAQRDIAGRQRVPWLYPLLVDDGDAPSRDRLLAHLASWSIETRPFFIPVHTMPPYLRYAANRPLDLSVTEQLGRCGLSLPTSSAMSHTETARVVDALMTHA